MKHLRKFNENHQDPVLQDILNIARDDCYVDIEDSPHEEHSVITISPYFDNMVNFQNYAFLSQVSPILDSPVITKTELINMGVNIYDRLLDRGIFSYITVYVKFEHQRPSSETYVNFAGVQNITEISNQIPRKHPLVEDEIKYQINKYSSNIINFMFKCHY